MFPFIQIWIQYLYVNNYPSTNYSIDPGSWPKLSEHLSPQLIFLSQPPGTRIPVNGRLVSARHQELNPLDDYDLSTVRISDKRVWMRIKDPTSDKRILSVSSNRILNIFLTWVESCIPICSVETKALMEGPCSR